MFMIPEETVKAVLRFERVPEGSSRLSAAMSSLMSGVSPDGGRDTLVRIFIPARIALSGRLTREEWISRARVGA
jgi:hypothetical protein